jgi:hemerythrin-like domain-containing protein
MHDAHRIICREHRNLVALLSCLKALVREAEAAERMPDFKMLEGFLDYLENYLNRFHHPKESAYLFPTLRRRDKSCEDLLSELESEHEKISPILARLRECLVACQAEGPSMLPALREAVEYYTRFELRHLTREEREVLPVAERLLRAEDWEEIDAAFRANEDPLFGANWRHEYERLFSEIAARSPVPIGPGRPSGD